MHGVGLGAGIFALPVCGQGEGLAVPGSGDGLAVGRELAADAVGVGNQEGSAEGEALVAVGIVGAAIEGGVGFVEAGGEEDGGFALAGDVGRHLEEVHAASGQDGGGEEFRLSAAAGRRALQLDDILTADLGSSRSFRHFGSGSLRLLAACSKECGRSDDCKKTLAGLDGKH